MTSARASLRDRSGSVQREIRIDRYETLRASIPDAERVRSVSLLPLNARTKPRNGCPIVDTVPQPVRLTYLVVSIECPATCEVIQELNVKAEVEAPVSVLRVLWLEKDRYGWTDGPLTASNGSQYSREGYRAS